VTGSLGWVVTDAGSKVEDESGWAVEDNGSEVSGGLKEGGTSGSWLLLVGVSVHGTVSCILVSVAGLLGSWAVSVTVSIGNVVTGTGVDIEGGSEWAGKSLGGKEGSSLGEGGTSVASEGGVVVSITLTSTGINVSAHWDWSWSWVIGVVVNALSCDSNGDKGHEDSVGVSHFDFLVCGSAKSVRD